MFEIAEALLVRLDAGEHVVVATIVEVSGSAPRTLGSAMAVTADDAVIGSISGGCIESEVYELAEVVRGDGRPRTARFGIADADALRAGLACGGEVTVLVCRLSPGDVDIADQLRLAASGRPAALALVLDAPGGGSGALVAPGDARLPERGVGERVRGALTARLSSGTQGVFETDCDGEPLRALCLVSTDPPRLLVFGAVDVAAALCDAGALLGYRVTVCDARTAFATAARYPSAHEVVARWPAEYLAGTDIDERTVICVLTHEERFAIPLLQLALQLPVAYVGAMGSRRTVARRRLLLREAGVAEGELVRLHSPIGLDLGGSTPAETALSILAEVTAVRHRAGARPLGETSGRIHRTVPA